jgi:diaminopimelate epimerase
LRLKFTKMQGAGNDFVVLDGVSQTLEISPQRARRIADRHFGVGCDQILLVERSRRADADFRYRIWNADGGEVEQCGNGARCFVRFVHDRGLTKKSEIRVETLSGVIAPRLEPDGQVTVDMGAPVFEPELVPFDAKGLTQTGTRWPLDVAGRVVPVAVLSMGNPHAVQTVADVEIAPVADDRRLHAGRRPLERAAASVGARRRRNPRMRHGRLRRGRYGRKRGPARRHGERGNARRPIDDTLARRGQSGVDDGTCRDRV